MHPKDSPLPPASILISNSCSLFIPVAPILPFDCRYPIRLSMKHLSQLASFHEKKKETSMRSSISNNTICATAARYV